EKPRILVIEREGRSNPELSQGLGERFEVVLAQTMARGLALLRQQTFAGVVVDTRQLAAVRWAGPWIQADEILDSIADGGAVRGPAELKILWTNPEFKKLTPAGSNPVDQKIYRVLGNPEHIGGEACPFLASIERHEPASAEFRIEGNRYIRLTATPV